MIRHIDNGCVALSLGDRGREIWGRVKNGVSTIQVSPSTSRGPCRWLDSAMCACGGAVLENASKSVKPGRMSDQEDFGQW